MVDSMSSIHFYPTKINDEIENRDDFILDD